MIEKCSQCTAESQRQPPARPLSVLSKDGHALGVGERFAMVEAQDSFDYLPIFTNWRRYSPSLLQHERGFLLVCAGLYITTTVMINTTIAPYVQRSSNAYNAILSITITPVMHAAL